MTNDEIIKGLDTSLGLLESEENDILIRVEKGIKLVKSALTQIRNLIVVHEFKTKTLEIFV